MNKNKQLILKRSNLFGCLGHASGFPENFGAVVIDDARIPILSITSENQVLALRMQDHLEPREKVNIITKYYEKIR